MGCCLHSQTDVQERLVPATSESTELQQSDYRSNIPTEQNTKWSANGYFTFRSHLEKQLKAIYRVPPVVIEIITDFCHIGLDEPRNKSVFMAETMRIDDANRLLVHYYPDVDATHYSTGQCPGRYDCVHSDFSFKPSSVITDESKSYIVYYEIKFIKLLTPFLLEQSMGISVGFRNSDWLQCVNEDYIIKSNGAMLGWFKYSIGLHNDDGNVFCQEFGEVNGRKTLTNNFGLSGGDIVGCGYNKVTKHVFFTKNGKLIASESVEFIDLGIGFDASVVFMSNQNAIGRLKKMKEEERECLAEFNFGSKPFAFNIARYDGETIPKIMTFMNDIL